MSSVNLNNHNNPNCGVNSPVRRARDITMITHGHFAKDQGAGWYTSAQVGSHENTRIEMWLVSSDPEGTDMPFTYWHDDTPECDVYMD